MGRRGSIVLFLCVQGLIYICFLWLDILRPESGLIVPLKYLSIVLCLVMSLVHLPRDGSRLIAAALALTLLADAFLLVLDRHYLWGVSLFCGVQALYFCRIHQYGYLRLLPSLLRRLGIGAAALILPAALGTPDPLLCLTALYITQLAANAVESLYLRVWGLRYRLFSAGLFLLLCCDLCVGLSNLPAMFPISGAGPLFAFARVGMWLFYLPSQVLITLSGLKGVDHNGW